MCEPIHPIQAMVDGMSAAWQAERAKTQLTLGGLIAALKELPPNAIVVGVGDPISYRGYYSDLAFEPNGTHSVADMLMIARECMGQVFEGYKGGDFVMGANTPLWSSAYGESSGARIMGLNVTDDRVTLVLAPEEY